MSKHVDTDDIRNDLLELHHYEFEKFIGALWELRGWRTQMTSEKSDGGIDVVATKEDPVRIRIGIEIKQWGKGNIGQRAIRELRGIKSESDLDVVIAVTTTGFTSGVEDSDGVKLVDGERLARLIIDLDARDLLADYREKGTWERIDLNEYLPALQVQHEVSNFPRGGETLQNVLANGQESGSKAQTGADQPDTETEPAQRPSTAAESTEVTTEPVAPTALAGIGPKTAQELEELNITSFRDLANVAPPAVASQTNLGDVQVTNWMCHARYCVETDVSELDGIGSVRTAKYGKAGIETIRDLLAADPAAVAERTDHSPEDIERWKQSVEKLELTPVRELHAVGEKRAEQLLDAGIVADRQLVGKNPETLSAEAGLPTSVTKYLVAQAECQHGSKGRAAELLVYADNAVEAVPGVGSTRAEKLAEAGIKSVVDLATSDPQEVAEQTQLDEETVQELAISAVHHASP